MVLTKPFFVQKIISFLLKLSFF